MHIDVLKIKEFTFAMTKPPENKESVFGEIIDDFIRKVNSYRHSLPLTHAILLTAHEQALYELSTYIETDVKEKKKVKGGIKFRLRRENIKRYLELEENAEAIAYSIENLSKNSIVSLVSEFDFYLSKLIRAMHSVNPKMILESTEKQISLSDLIFFTDVDQIHEYILEKEIDSILRESHSDHFEWFEKKLKTTLRDDTWPEFIEITERRNLFVHTGGLVTSQYLNNCKKCGAKIGKELKVGDKIQIDPKYIARAHAVFFEVGIKLGHVIWRKMQDEQRKNADAHLNSVCYDLLIQARPSLAENLLIFATEVIKTFSSDEIRRYLIINRAMATKLLKKDKDALVYLNGHDWSSCEDRYKLVVAVFNSKFEEAAKLIIKAGAENQLFTHSDYEEFPIFTDFIKTKEFLSAYEKIYKKKFEKTEYPVLDKLDLKFVKSKKS